MAFLDTSHKKKSATLTVLTALLLFFLLFTLGLRYLDPPVSYGMEVRLGNFSEGQPSTQPKLQASVVSTPPSDAEQKPLDPEKTSPEESTPASDDSALTATQEESPVAINEEPNPETVVNEQKPVREKTPIPPEPTVSDQTKKLLSNFIKKSKGEQNKAESKKDENTQDQTGKPEGNPYAATHYDGANASGRKNGFGLNGRRLLSNSSKEQECNEEGVVVVRISVNRQGRVTHAVPGVKGSTNTHPCLLKPAMVTAKSYQWNMDLKAPEKQIGFVVIQFKLGE